VIENAQKKVEARNFDIRKHLLDYDDVMNKQRRAFYERRRAALTHGDVHAEILSMAEGAIVSLLDAHWPAKADADAEVMAELAATLEGQFGMPFDPQQPPFVAPDDSGPFPKDRDAFGHAILDRAMAFLEEKQKRCDALAEEHASLGYPRFDDFERDILLRILDAQWKDHLHTMDGLREGIGLRGYASRDPKLEYQREGYALFDEMNERIDLQSLDLVYKFALPQPVLETAPRPAPLLTGVRGGQRDAAAASRRDRPEAGKAGKVGRNDPCPCGSGKKYKKCCGAA
jgi:preprotein translocase subunit SecA